MTWYSHSPCAIPLPTDDPGDPTFAGATSNGTVESITENALNQIAAAIANRVRSIFCCRPVLMKLIARANMSDAEATRTSG